MSSTSARLSSDAAFRIAALACVFAVALVLHLTLGIGWGYALLGGCALPTTCVVVCMGMIGAVRRVLR